MNILASLAVLVGLVILLMLPAVLLVWAAIRLPWSAKQGSIIFIIVGALMLGISSLDFLITIFTAIRYNPEALARYAIVVSIVTWVFRYAGMLFLAAGLLRLSSQLSLAREST